MDAEAFKAGQKALWALGDFPALAQQIRPASTQMMDSAGVQEGDLLLDVACGTGNLAIPAAERGATVTGLDITPSLLEVAREDSAAAGLKIEFVEGDAENMPFADDSFDKVVSVFGVMFAPQHEVAAAELQRTCRPGGTIATAAWTPEGMNGQLFDVIGAHMPARPPDTPMPFMWGDEGHVRSIFEPGVEWTFSKQNATFSAPSADEFFAFMEEKLSPLVLARMALEPQGKYEGLRADLREFYDGFNSADDGSFVGQGEYLMSVGQLPD